MEKSRILVKALRHAPHTLGLKLDARGWVKVSDVLESLSINKDELDIMVETNNKKRFEYNQTEDKIRASQGHSIKTLEVFKDWKVYTPHNLMYHGTAKHVVKSILESTLYSQSRTHVHLSLDVETAYNVGKRHGVPIILEVDAVRMHNDGYKFYMSKNGVVLVDEVPGKYISISSTF